MNHPSVDELWERFRKTRSGVPDAPPQVFHFCLHREDADECAELVAAGRKRATATSLEELELQGQPLPRSGDLAVVTGFDGNAVAVIETDRVEVHRLGDIDEHFAMAEGEGDGSLAWWREAHLRYYSEVLADSGTPVDDDLLIACEHFRVVLAAVPQN